MSRLKGDNIAIPIVYGTTASPIDISASNKFKDHIPIDHSHRWKIYLKSPEGRDLSILFESVSFKLHQSFIKPERVIKKPPFELEETGWGEFEIKIKIQLKKEAQEGPITVKHLLKLFPNDSAENYPVLSEKYDELLIEDPTEAFRETFQKKFLESPADEVKDNQFNAEVAESEMQKIQKALKVVKERLNMERSKLEKQNILIKELRASYKPASNSHDGKSTVTKQLEVEETPNEKTVTSKKGDKASRRRRSGSSTKSEEDAVSRKRKSSIPDEKLSSGPSTKRHKRNKSKSQI